MKSKTCIILTRHTKPAYTQKRSTFWCQKCTKPAHTQKNQKFWYWKVTKPAYTQKKIKTLKNLRLYVGLTGIDELVFDFFVFLNICRFGAFSLSKLLIFLSICRFGALLASKCWSFLSICRFWAFPYQNVCFFWVYAGLRDLRFTKPAYTQKRSTFWCQKCTKPAYTQKNQKFW